MTKVLVLGHKGQIGEPFFRALKEGGYEVKGFDMVDGDDVATMEPYIELGFDWADYIIFLAFDVGGSTYLKDYQHSYKFLQNNVRLMDKVFNKTQLYNKKLVFASSQMSNMNHSPYGVLKRLGEFYTRALGGIVVKFWNVYGVEHDPDKFHVITDFINMARRDGEIRMRTTGEELRQFLHVDDCSRALISLLENWDDLDKAVDYDITSFEWHSILEVASIIAERYYAEVTPGVEKDVVQGVLNEPSATILKYWAPKLDLEDGIEKVIKGMDPVYG